MQPSDLHTEKNQRQSIFPKTHAAVAAALTATLGTLLLALPGGEPEAERMVHKELAVPVKPLGSEQPKTELAVTHQTSKPIKTRTQAPIEEPLKVIQAENWEEQKEEPNWNSLEVRKGDNLSRLFKRANLSDRDVYRLLAGHKEAKSLKRLKPGQHIDVSLTEDNRLSALQYRPNRLETHVFEWAEGKLTYEKKEATLKTHRVYREAKIDTSLFLAGKKIGLDDNVVMEMANIFGWDIDFVLDIRKGDTFRILYEENFLDGEKYSNGAILAAEFVNKGDHFRAVRYTHENGDSHYYTPDGKSMRKAFLQAPLDFRRISSNFNPKRLHPVFKTVRPHRGTDYAAARGTPVWASGDGRVLKSGYTKANGNYVVIQHGNNVKTKYLHLHKRLVKSGQRVKQKQKIGTVGSTGYSTAPHLHYEFLLDGVHRNPRTIVQKLPKAASIPRREMVRFSQQTQPVIAQLQSHSNTQFAANEKNATFN
ncbi:peptidoglycan DD-metalloendopeptidase family protein [Marinibactrum halimedae]|uniref:Peptidase M23 n=1 Tax=Marinibactrum halimedae TaxID=1444977 RepID=A0AA37T8J4_9GAMM|nr:peptidoglycan DD-metalloendopeptidase family protein [Marinibactrum halimedae]MCD9460495.1 peptidoglycan DD-metalloendopeptidase family protein [Marinibactrum halimedae]GLS25901.1 peptidase M23 [Marinibactrum halimedae]